MFFVTSRPRSDLRGGNLSMMTTSELKWKRQLKISQKAAFLRRVFYERGPNNMLRIVARASAKSVLFLITEIPSSSMERSLRGSSQPVRHRTFVAASEG